MCVCVCVCVCMCVCVCGVCVSGNACDYFISHPWEELHLCNGHLSVYIGTSASIHSLTC